MTENKVPEGVKKDQQESEGARGVELPLVDRRGHGNESARTGHLPQSRLCSQCIPPDHCSVHHKHGVAPYMCLR